MEEIEKKVKENAIEMLINNQIQKTYDDINELTSTLVTLMEELPEDEVVVDIVEKIIDSRTMEIGLFQGILKYLGNDSIDIINDAQEKVTSEEEINIEVEDEKEEVEESYYNEITSTMLERLKRKSNRVNEELKKQNAEKLYKLLDGDIHKLSVIISDDISADNEKYKVEQDYVNAVKIIENGIQAKGCFEENEEKSYIVKVNLRTAKKLAKQLCQDEFIAIEFISSNRFVARRFRKLDDKFNDYYEVENTSDVLIDKELDDKFGYTEVEDTRFTFALYGSDKKDEFKNLTENK